MKRWSDKWYGAAVLLSLFTLSSAAFAVSVTDDTGQLIELEQPAQRIVTLAPFLTELVFAVNAQQALVGTVEYSNYPEQAKSIPRIGNYENVSVEKLVALRPQLVVAWESANNLSQLGKIEQFGIRVYRSAPRQLTDIARTVANLGRLTGHAQQGQAVAKAFTDRLESLKSHYAGRAKVSAFYQVWHEPIYTINGQHVISQVMALCGLENVFEDLPVMAPKISLEAVLNRNPQMIIASGMATARPDWLDMWKKWPGLSAVQYNNLYFVHPDLIQRHSLRILDGADIVCRQADQARLNLQGGANPGAE